MYLHLLLLSIFSIILNNAQIPNPCEGKSNLCVDQITNCETIFAPKADGSWSDNCADIAYSSFAHLCHKTCQICCVEPCVDVNERCDSWTDGFCTNPFYSDEERWAYCRKKCNLC
ncbi:hypothetical protein PRIPAC_87300 [Pristionchus pacificus]|uniref:ShK domain-containing protein n=1 Tax=Pristionchus pacificus TaxID=54126 RepID=A0A2A6CYX0_PRIPA|nr:hypothetical protein PRIPAC_87300 [Pristionchus pacificus]|eukprot:PDM83257.1 ShK domain-containing protein [Pristionchus pacificus]